MRKSHALGAMTGAALLAASMGSMSGALAADKVSIAVVNASSDAGLFVADAKGYFKQEGIEASFVSFDTGAKMVAPLGAGQLDAGGGAASAGLYNAVGRGIRIKIVADKAHNVKGAGFQAIMVRKDLVDSGKVKTLADLKGMKVAITGAGGSDASVLNEAMKSVGLGYSDVEKVYLGFPQHAVAFQNGAIDASISTEPTVSRIVELGAAVRFTGNDAFYPNAQTATILFSGDFAEKRPDVAKRFMKAYIRAVRDFNAAVVDGRLTGPGADEMVAILAKYSVIKDPKTLRTMIVHGTHQDGKLNVESLRKDLAFFKETGDVKGDVSVEQVVDSSFVDAALKELGPAKK
ncbi:MAG: ABC transporter substrate-binding protein [Beijerinckiaceae bacterium]|nr:ABC transporter substrate-binding protein [Beijerinckiaceae bacterium]